MYFRKIGGNTTFLYFLLFSDSKDTRKEAKSITQRETAAQQKGRIAAEERQGQ